MSTRTTTEPQRTGRSLAEQLCAELGIEPDEFMERCRLAKWKAARFREELATDGWQERFAAAVTDGREEILSGRMHRALRYGPLALSEARFSELLGRIDAKLRPLAEGLRPEHGGRLICGPTGCGKTSALVAVVRRLETERPLLGPNSNDDIDALLEGMRRLPEVVWVRAQDLPVARLAHALGKGEAELVENAKHAGILVLDDLGWESARAGAADVVVEVLAERYDHGRITWATTGLRPEQLSERYGDALVRRVCETGGRAGKVVDLWPKGAK